MKVLYRLWRHNIPATDEVVNRIFDAAKQSSRVLRTRNCWLSAHRPALRCNLHEATAKRSVAGTVSIRQSTNSFEPAIMQK